MPYNKAREEQKWKQRKKAEEAIMRMEGFDENAILDMRSHDWKDFDSDRCNELHKLDAYPIQNIAVFDQTSPETLEDFLDSIENEQLYQLLIKEKKLRSRRFLCGLRDMNLLK